MFGSVSLIEIIAANNYIQKSDKLFMIGKDAFGLFSSDWWTNFLDSVVYLSMFKFRYVRQSLKSKKKLNLNICFGCTEITGNVNVYVRQVF